MLIPIRYPDGRHDMVKPVLLDRLLADRKVAGFKRSNGWVAVGRDPIRGQGEARYAGPDRRAGHA